MESLRPASSDKRHNPVHHQQNVADDVPPPPAPFPIDLIESATRQSPSVSAAAEQEIQRYQLQFDDQVNLIVAQRACIDVLELLLPDSATTFMSPSDQRFAAVLGELLEASYELETFQKPLEISPSANENEGRAPFSTLVDSLSALHAAATHRSPPSLIVPESTSASQLHPAVAVVREELAWGRIESLSHAVIELTRERTRSTETRPPEYVHTVTSETDTLPSYQSLRVDEDDMGNSKDTKSKELEARGETSSQREKMMLDLDAVTSAIERLHTVAPQLTDQRSELRAGPSTPRIRNPEAEVAATERAKMRELEDIWDKIERANGRRRYRGDDDRRVNGESWSERRATKREAFLNGWMLQAEAGKFNTQDSIMPSSVSSDLARARELRDRDHFLRDLIEQSADARLGDQDAKLNTPVEQRDIFLNDVLERSRAARLHGQDFPIPRERKLVEQRDELHGAPAETLDDPHELVTAQDFLAGNPISTSAALEIDNTGRVVESSRSRSNSAGTFKKIAGIVRRSSLGLALKPQSAIDVAGVTYIAEHQENLRAVHVMVHGTGVTTADLHLEVISPNDAVITSNRDSLFHFPVTLPTSVPMQQSVSLTPADLYLETKLAALSTSTTTLSLNTAIAHALSAPDLRIISPRGFCCTSCDREVAVFASTPTTQYKDLPSEHWAEMLEVWMCHADPEFTAHLAKHTRDGFWPTRGTVLVGGSYLLVEDSEVRRANLTVDNSSLPDLWQIVSCPCGEVLGKQRPDDGRPGAGAVRFSKWAIALLRDDGRGESVEPVRFPLSVFVISDMLELAQAHASHRFVISDELTGERRLAIWLFHPSVHVSYRRPALPASPGGTLPPSPLRSMPSFMERQSVRSRRSSIASSSGAISSSMSRSTVRTLRAAKIMYKVIDTYGPNSEYAHLPGFGPGGQVEHLVYSRDACVRLITALRESTALYPLARRVMGAFDMGFLERL